MMSRTVSSFSPTRDPQRCSAAQEDDGDGPHEERWVRAHVVCYRLFAKTDGIALRIAEQGDAEFS
jgi:hypothetical protein